MHTILKNLSLIKNEIKEIVEEKQLKLNPQIIAVTKTFPLDKINPLIDEGHTHFGENKVQEAEVKWKDVRKNNKKIKLHMVGKLQSNKAKKAVEIFDYIHSLDNTKLAQKISFFEKKFNKRTKLFIQVNVANEEQKSGINLNDLYSFYSYCLNELSLNVIGLMCLPPINSDSKKYFDLLKVKSLNLKLNDLSMGMSSDYKQAILSGSTYLRLGTALFGERKI